LRGAIAAHLVVALAIVALDLRWISEPRRGACSSRDVGLAVAIGVRVCLINVILLPLSVVGISMRG
jgi:hypothetical protein